jgi:sirohydrochlorin ferrochelatase
MRAVVVVGHGSLRAGSGAAMIRLAARAREAGIAPLVAAGFLNYSQPRFAQALARCLARGATDVIVQPYFLVPGKFVREDMPRLIAAAQAAHPAVMLRLAAPFGDHPALAALVLKRAAEAEAAAASSQHSGPLGYRRREPTGLLIMAHGSPDPHANRPIEAIAGRIRAAGRYAPVVVCFMDLNEPDISSAIDDLVAQGLRRIVAVPYFLQLGGHVAEDLPQIIDAARARHPTVSLSLAGHLGYDPLLVAVIADRVAEAERQDADTPGG